MAMIQRCLAVLFVALPLFGQAALVPWSGTTERIIPPDGAVNIPLTLAADVKTPPVVRQVLHGGEEIDKSAVLAKWNGTGLTRDLALTVVAKPTARIGTYTTLVHIATPDAAKFAERILEVKLVRRGPAISIPTPLRAERVTYVPRLFERWYPESWTIHETSLRDSFTPAAKRWTVTLRTADTAPRGSVVYLDLASPAIAAGGQALLRPTGGASCCPFGTVSGKFSIHEVPLAAPIEVSVEVLSRLSRLWLLAILIGSILAGHYVRKVLEGRRAIAAARVAAAAVRKDLDALLATVKGDDAFTDRVQKERTKLHEAARINDAAQITPAVTAAVDAVAKIRADHAKARKDASDLLKKLRDAVGDGNAQSRQLRAAAEALDQQLDAAEARLAAGRVTGMLAEVETIQKTAIESSERALIGWKTSMTRLLDEMKQWADIDPGLLAPIRDQVAALTGKDLDQVKTAYATAAVADAQLNAQLPSFLDDAGRIVNLVKETTGDHTLQPPSGDTTNPDAIEKQLKDLRIALQSALRKAVPQGQTEPAAIKESKFIDAVDAIKALRPKPQKAAEDDSLPEMGGLVVAGSAEGPAAPPATLSGTIDVSDDPIVGEPLQLTFHVTDNGTPVKHADVQWWNGESYLAAGVTIVYTPPSTAPVVLRARTTVGARTIERTVRIAAAPSSIFDPDQLRGEIAHVSWIQTGVAGFFITLIGYSMFAKAFIGTLGDLAAAALWGFATDITLAKVAELATPIVQGAVKATGAAAPAAPPAPAPPKKDE